MDFFLSSHRSVLLIFLQIRIVLCGRGANGGTAQGLNRLPETERHARLVAGAKKEGTVVWYVAMDRANADELVKAFEAEYPFLKVNVLTGRGASLLNRIIAEYRANRYQYDLFNTRSTTLNTLKKAGAIMRYHTPLRRFLRAGFYDDEGYLNGLFATPWFFFSTPSLFRKRTPLKRSKIF